MNAPQFLVIHTVKGFNIVNEAEADVFLQILCCLHYPANVGSVVSGSSISSKPSLYMCKFLVHVLLKYSLKDFPVTIFLIVFVLFFSSVSCLEKLLYHLL